MHVHYRHIAANVPEQTPKRCLPVEQLLEAHILARVRKQAYHEAYCNGYQLAFYGEPQEIQSATALSLQNELTKCLHAHDNTPE